jgi:hypothetical protein
MQSPSRYRQYAQEAEQQEDAETLQRTDGKAIAP